MAGAAASGGNKGRWDGIATSLAVAVALALFAIKLAAWLVSGSVAVLGSLADSAVDMMSSALAFTAVRWAAAPPDRDHRFGHQKAEAVSALLQTVLIAGSATFVLGESVRKLIEPQPMENSSAAVAALGVTVVLTSILVTVQTMATRRSGNLTIKADRAHYVSDILSNGGLLLAVLLAGAFDLPRADAVAGLVAAGFLYWSVREVAGYALPQLLDEELPEEERAEIEAIIASDRDVRGFHNLRTRRAGDRRFIQVDLEMLGSLSLAEAHRISARVTARLQERFPGSDVLVHQDTTDDTEEPLAEAQAG